MTRCKKCWKAVDLSAEHLGKSFHCPGCGAGPLQLTRGTVWLLILGGAAYLPIMGFLFVEAFGVEPEALIVERRGA